MRMMIDLRKERQLGWRQHRKETAGLNERPQVQEQEIVQETTTDNNTATVRGAQGPLQREEAS